VSLLLRIERPFNKNVLSIEHPHVVRHGPPEIQRHSPSRDATLKRLSVRVQRVAFEFDTANAADSYEEPVVVAGTSNEITYRYLFRLWGMNWR
jgi:hypothetical protein